MSAHGNKVMWVDYSRRDPKFWPERNTGDLWQPGALAAEVEAALAKPIPEHSERTTPIVMAPPPPPMPNAEAARLVGVSPAAMLKRTRRFGQARAIAMGGRHDRAKRIKLKRSLVVDDLLIAE